MTTKHKASFVKINRWLIMRERRAELIVYQF